jgi:glycosyltransferase involved in cell wall biosynthesis
VLDQAESPSLTAHPAGRPLRVAHISATSGGVANAARRLHLGLLAVGADSTFYTSKAPGDGRAPHTQAAPQPGRLLHYADQASKLVHERIGLTGLTHVSSLRWAFPGYDVLHFHGAVSNWFNLRALRRLNRHHALAWTMHDKHLGTGACGYPEMWDECDRWRTGCGQCPKARNEGWLVDLTGYVHRQKQAILRDVHMGIVAPNQWMYDFIAASPITKAQPLACIPYGVDTDTFRPHPADEARAALGLPQSGRLLLSVASRLGQPRKGLQYYPALLRHLRDVYDGDLGLALAGDQLPADMLAVLQAIMPVYALGHIGDQHRLAQAYSAADLFVITSTMDNFPNVVLESLACGTPAAGFSVGGIPDMIVQGETGILVTPGDAEALAQGLAALLAEPARLAQMRAICRARARADFSLHVQAERYLAFYRQLIDAKQGLNV